jgi:hypothetical protein
MKSMFFKAAIYAIIIAALAFMKLVSALGIKILFKKNTIISVSTNEAFHEVTLI